ncbi:unnamed protein product [Moneuplotes crassus]|uniref:Uncharacterized protein n=1 Tax=Euplotes crassus TaxID=5936 RepID=A0AAD1UGE7_EUPCR|nr:unnamed protein product [Moneuplotes crassus]
MLISESVSRIESAHRKGKSLFRIGKNPEFIKHGLNETNKEYLDKIAQGKIKENPYSYVSKIYGEISQRYNQGFYEPSFMSSSESELGDYKHDPRRWRRRSPLKSDRGDVRTKSKWKKERPSDMYSLYRRVYKLLLDGKYDKKKYEHDYNIRSYNVLNISVPDEVKKNDNLGELPLIKKLLIKTNLRKKFAKNDQIKLLSKNIENREEVKACRKNSALNLAYMNKNKKFLRDSEQGSRAKRRREGIEKLKGIQKEKKEKIKHTRPGHKFMVSKLLQKTDVSLFDFKRNPKVLFKIQKPQNQRNSVLDEAMKELKVIENQMSHSSAIHFDNYKLPDSNHKSCYDEIVVDRSRVNQSVQRVTEYSFIEQ